MKPPQIVCVEWIDAVTNPNWRTMNDVQNDKTPLSYNYEYGFVIKTKNKSSVVIGHGWNKETGDVSSTTAIPKAWVKRVRPL